MMVSIHHLCSLCFWQSSWGVTCHRIIRWFGLEGTFKGRLIQTPCSEQEHLQPDQVTRSPVQPDLECVQGWGIYHLSGQLLLVFHHPHTKEFLPYMQSKSALLQFKTITACPIATGPAEKPVLIFLISPL